jgi:lipopolysaccharide export LptBFGC system permease protein LptF
MWRYLIHYWKYYLYLIIVSMIMIFTLGVLAERGSNKMWLYLIGFIIIGFTVGMLVNYDKKAHQINFMIAIIWGVSYVGFVYGVLTFFELSVGTVLAYHGWSEYKKPKINDDLLQNRYRDYLTF